MSFNAFLRGLAPVAIAAAIIAAPATAHATETTININPGNLGQKAADAEQDCDANFGGGPYVGEDVWVFNLPKGQGDDFVSVTATFTTGSGDVELTIPTDGGDIVKKGTSKAWIVTDAGWTLKAASAVVTGATGQNAFFVLTHTCAASDTPGEGSPTPSDNPSTSGSPSAPGSGSPSENPSATPSGDDVLPTTGTSLTTGIAVGAGLAALGVAALVMMRRRRASAATWGDQ